jgi:hypothetical protein
MMAPATPRSQIIESSTVQLIALLFEKGAAGLSGEEAGGGDVENCGVGAVP